MTLAQGFLAAVLAAAFASMVIFAALGGRRDEDSDRKGSQFLGVAGGFLVHWFMWTLGPLERAALASGLSPDALNFAGLVSGAVSGFLIATGRLEAAGWTIALGGACDILDGRIARTRHLVSDYGKFMDSTLDRFVEVFVFLGFVSYLQATPFGAFTAAAAICGSLLVSYARARGETVGVAGPTGLMQRAERLVLTALACVLDGPAAHHLGWPAGSVVLWTLAVIAAGTAGTALYRTIVIGRALRRRIASDPPAAG